jgi:hypothetical protein
VNLEFQLSKNMRASLAVYNTLGRRVALLFSGENFEAGTHRFQWSPESASSGIYFAKLSAAGVVQTKKLVLMK